MDKQQIFHNLILALIAGFLFFFVAIFFKAYTTRHPILMILLITLLFFATSYWLNRRYDEKRLKKITAISKDLHFKNIIYSLMAESVNIDDRKKFYDLLLAKSIEAIPTADKGSVLRMKTDFLMVFEAASGHDLDQLKTVELYIDQTFLYKRTQGKMDKTTIINDFKKFNEKTLDKSKQETLDGMIQEINSIISTPIWVGNKIWGMINIDSYTPNAFAEADIESLEIFAIEASKVIMLFDTLEKNNYLVKYDVLTDVYNRSHFNELAMDFMEKSNLMATFVSVDLDHFKRINDLYGHQAGDDYLVYFVKVMKKFLQDSDIFARYGGDEFTILMAHRTLDEAENRMYEIQKALCNRPYIINGREEVIEFSFGLAHYPSEGNSVKGLLARSDKKMYCNKNSKL